MELPGYIFQILENEFQQMQVEWLKKIADRYSIDLEELKETCIEPLKIEPNQKTKIEVIRKTKPRKTAVVDERCKARIWNRGLGGQCSRKHLANENLCTQHLKEMNQHQKLRHGWYEEQPPMTVFNGKNKTLYK